MPGSLAPSGQAAFNFWGQATAEAQSAAKGNGQRAIYAGRNAAPKRMRGTGKAPGLQCMRPAAPWVPVDPVKRECRPRSSSRTVKPLNWREGGRGHMRCEPRDAQAEGPGDTAVARVPGAPAQWPGALHSPCSPAARAGPQPRAPGQVCGVLRTRAVRSAGGPAGPDAPGAPLWGLSAPPAARWDVACAWCVRGVSDRITGISSGLKGQRNSGAGRQGGGWS